MLLYSFVTEPAVRQLSEKGQDLSASAYSLCFLYGALTAPLGLVLYILNFGSLGRAMAVLFGALSGLMVHEAVRQIAIARRRTVDAIWVDAVWLFSSALILAVFEVTAGGVTTAAQALGIWSAGAWFGAAVAIGRGCVRIGQLSGAIDWFMMSWKGGVKLSLEGLLTAASGHVVLLVLAAGLGFEAVAIISVIHLAFAGAGLTTSAVRMLGQPWFLATHRASGSTTKQVLATSFGIAIVVFLNGMVWLAVPHSVGRVLLGNRWQDVVGLVLLGVAYMIPRSVTAAPLLAMRILGYASRVLTVRLLVSAIQLLAAVVAVLLDFHQASRLILVLTGGAYLSAGCWFVAYLSAGDVDGESIARAKTVQ